MKPNPFLRDATGAVSYLVGMNELDIAQLIADGSPRVHSALGMASGRFASRALAAPGVVEGGRGRYLAITWYCTRAASLRVLSRSP
jgi:hypothetical protein